MSAWSRTFGSPGQEEIVAAYNHDKMIGILPLRRTNKGLPMLRFDALEMLGSEHGGADYLDLIAPRNDRGAVLRAILAHHADESLISFNNLEAGSETAADLMAMTERDRTLKPRVQVVDICPRLNLAEGWKGILARSRRASNFRRRLKQFERMRNFEFRSIANPNELPEAFERFLWLHTRLWERRSFSELSGSPKLIKFHRAVIANMASTGTLRFDELWAEGKCIGSIYGFDDGRKFYYYNIGYRPEYSSQSPGLVLLGLSIRNSADKGLSCYDLLRGNEKYKLDWADETRELLTIDLVGPRFRESAWLRTELLKRQAKGVLKRFVPASITESLKHHMRSLKGFELKRRALFGRHVYD